MYIYLVRHGQSEGNIDKSKYFEKLDCNIELTDKGRDDSKSAANKIMDLINTVNPFTQTTMYPKFKTNLNFFHSSYTRAIQTTEIITNTIHNSDDFIINKVYETPICREREWGGLRDIVAMGSKTEQHFNFYYRPIGGESFADCYQRVMSFHQWMAITTKCEHNVVVAHGEFNRLYLMYLLNWKIDEFTKYKNPKNGEVFLIRVENDKFINRNSLSAITPLTICNKYNNAILPSSFTLD